MSETFTSSNGVSSGVQILPGFILLCGSNAAFTRRSSVNSSSPKNSGPYSER
ncbi:Uncharacterised protein [Vibrio cholerae]|nr:Uncharacterised protein [Vibrio cholerae]